MKDQVVMTYFIRIRLCERHPHTSGLHKSKYCVMPHPFPAERFGKGLVYAKVIGSDHGENYNFSNGQQINHNNFVIDLLSIWKVWNEGKKHGYISK